MNKTKVGSGSKNVKQLFMSQLDPVQKLLQKIDSFFKQETKMIFLGDNTTTSLNFTFFTHLDKVSEIV